MWRELNIFFACVPLSSSASIGKLHSRATVILLVPFPAVSSLSLSLSLSFFVFMAPAVDPF